MSSRPHLAPVFGVVRFYNFLPRDNPFLDEVLGGLSQPQKSLPTRYFHDECGSKLFEGICERHESHPSHQETTILRKHLSAIAHFAGPETELIELRGGIDTQTYSLVEALRPPLYVPVDIDGDALKLASEDIARQFPWLNITGMVADYMSPLELPAFVGLRIRRKVVFLSGLTLGRFTPAEALELLRHARRLAGAGGALLIGVDLKKHRSLLDAAYNDAKGLNAELHRNLLARINRDLGGDFQPGRFDYRAVCNETAGRMEMHLESRYSQFANVAGRRFDFAPGETIHIGISCQYTEAEFQALARGAGFVPETAWTDPAQIFSLQGMRAV